MKILLVGNGAREHVIGETLAKSSYKPNIYVYGGAKNPGLLGLSDTYEVGSLKDFDKLKEFAGYVKPDFALVGPDDPIADGAGDLLQGMGIPIASPLMTVARLESSKSFARDLLNKHSIPGNPKFRVFYEIDGVREYIEDELDGEYVIKYDGLKGGKGVKVSGDHLETVEDGMKYAIECLESSGRVIVEEKLIGVEFSLMCFCDGVTIRPMPAIQDHKRAYDGDEGPNTGGMGSYSYSNHSLPFLKSSDIDEALEITRRVAEALLIETGEYFKGIMYGGFIAVKDGIRLIEYNARFGDPEAMNALPILKTDFVDVCKAIIDTDLKSLDVEFENKATVCKYVVPEGYPIKSKAGEKIEIGEIPEGVNMYYSSVDQREDGIYLSSSRALAFVGIDKDIEKAEKLASSALDSVSGPVFYRRDVGTQALIQKRVDALDALRSGS